MQKIREECGVFGIFVPGEDVARITFFAQLALQHRGQESAGIGVLNSGQIKIKKGMGLVPQIFEDDDLELLKGYAAVGHNRYSTTGSSHLKNAGPFFENTELGPIALAHNGNLVNTLQLRDELEKEGVEFSTTTDTEVMIKMLAFSQGKTWLEKIKRTVPLWMGAYSVVILTQDSIFVIRDPLGIRPLSLGSYGKSGFVVASETCAFDTIGAKNIREVSPGEIIKIDEEGIKSDSFSNQERDKGLCIFEYIYFSRPDSVIGGKSVYQVRKKMGQYLAREAGVDVDLVIAVPDSGTPAAIGYAEESGIPFGIGLIKNRYIGRTFISPNQNLRDLGVRLKLNPLKKELKGKRIVLVDDSIVRGSTSGKIVKLLKEAGAKEVHVRISSPPMKYSCYFGVDTSNQEELIASRNTVAEIEKIIKADSLKYLSLPGLVEATGFPARDFCLSCFNEDYPIPVQLDFNKLFLES